MWLSKAGFGMGVTRRLSPRIVCLINTLQQQPTDYGDLLGDRQDVEGRLCRREGGACVERTCMDHCTVRRCPFALIVDVLLSSQFSAQVFEEQAKEAKAKYAEEKAAYDKKKEASAWPGRFSHRSNY